MRKVEVVPYENHWCEKFLEEAKLLKAALPELVKMHHIGSTSVPGLAAKPIIDMAMQFTYDVEKYIEGKDAFIQKIDETAEKWAKKGRMDR